MLEQFRNVSDLELTMEMRDVGGGEVVILKGQLIMTDTINVSRLEFLAPPSLAGQFILTDGDTSYTYLPVMEQIIKEPRQEVTGIGGLFASMSQAGEQLFDREIYEVSLLENTVLDKREVYVVDLRDRRVGAEDDVWGFREYVDAENLRPVRLESYDQQGETIAIASFSAWQENPGLEAETLRRLPRGAEIIEFP
jgi:outer membrane lipoprotein-sorting protein